MASCFYCSQQFNLANRRPKQLQCGHTKCLQCVEEEFYKKSEILCRIDKQVTHTIPEELPDDTLMLNSLKQLSQRIKEQLCPKHDFERHSMCSKCKVLICNICSFQDHLKHPLMSFQMVQQQYQADFKQCLQRVAIRRIQVEDQIVKLTSQMKSFQKECDIFTDNVEDACDKLFDHIKIIRESLVQSTRHKLQTFFKKITAYQNKLQETLNKFRYLEYEEDNDFFELLQNLEQAYNFNSDKDLLNFPSYELEVKVPNDINSQLKAFENVFKFQIVQKQKKSQTISTLKNQSLYNYSLDDNMFEAQNSDEI